MPGGAWTVLVPSNEALSDLGEEGIAYYLNPDNQAALAYMIYSHVIPQVHPSESLLNGQVIRPMSWREIVATRNTDGTIHFNGALLGQYRDMLARNGVIHGIEGLLFPPPFNFTSTPTSSLPSEAPSTATTAPSSQAPTVEITVPMSHVPTSPSHMLTENESAVRLSTGAVIGIIAAGLLLVMIGS